MKAETPFVVVEHLAKHYRGPGGWRGAGRLLRAVDDVSFTLAPGESVGLLGESGSGKTTLGRLLLKLTEPTAGSITIAGQSLAGLRGQPLKAFRRQAQLIFQNPFDALNPRFTIGRCLREPLLNAGLPRAEQGPLIERALALARFTRGLELLDQHPHQLSGGQLQRVVIARALILQPRFVVADEPVSMLDVSVRAGILNLLRGVSRALGLTAVYISHDLSLVRYLCSRTLVLYRGALVEDAPTKALCNAPRHPYSQALVAAVPSSDPAQRRLPLPLVASTAEAPVGSGCRFAARCPLVMPICRTEEPPLVAVAPNHRVACHLGLPAA